MTKEMKGRKEKCLDLLKFTFIPIWFIIDAGIDLNLAYFYYTEKEYWSFALTLFCAVASILFINLFSFLYRLLYEEDEDNNPTRKTSVTDLLVFIIQLEVLKRFVELIITEYKVRKERKMISSEESRQIFVVTMMKVIECFTEAIPQLMLQIYIIVRRQNEIAQRHAQTNYRPDPAKNPELEILYQTVSISTSLIVISWTAMSYSQNVHHFLDKFQKISWIGSAFYFLWHLGTLAARIMVLSLFASSFPMWIWAVLGLRWLIMTCWFLYEKTNIFDKTIYLISFAFVFGYMRIFCFINSDEEVKLRMYVFYYIYEFTENALLLAIWGFSTDLYTWYFYPAVTVIPGCFILGLTFLVTFYNTVLQYKKGESKQWKQVSNSEEIERYEVDSPERVKIQTLEGARRNTLNQYIFI